jgi:hypothetical protein
MIYIQILGLCPHNMTQIGVNSELYTRKTGVMPPDRITTRMQHLSISITYNGKSRCTYNLRLFINPWMVNLWWDLEHRPLLREFWKQGHLMAMPYPLALNSTQCLTSSWICHPVYSITSYFRDIFINFMVYSADVGWVECEQSRQYCPTENSKMKLLSLYHSCSCPTSHFLNFPVISENNYGKTTFTLDEDWRTS